MVNPDTIRLYPMTMDVYGQRTHTEYVDEMAGMIVRMVVGYRFDYDELRKLIDYAEENHNRLNT